MYLKRLTSVDVSAHRRNCGRLFSFWATTTEWAQMLGEEENIAHVQLIFPFSSTVTEFG